MEIKTAFSPVTIKLETEEDVSLLKEILQRAKDHYVSQGFFTSRRCQDSFAQKCDYIKGRIQK